MIDQTITSMGTMPTQFNTLINHSTIGAGQQATDRATSLADEYRQKQREMDERLKREIESHQVASVYLPGQNPLQPMKMNENQSDITPTYEAKPQKFVRSTRSIALRIKEDYDNHAVNMEQEKLDLIQRLNEAILELDRLNQEKGELNEKLIKLFQFTRDMERHTLRSDDLLTVVDESLKEELRSEKQQGICMQERMKSFEEEKYRIREKVMEVESRKEEFGHQRVEIQSILEQRSRQVDELQIEYQETKERINAFQSQVDDLRGLCCQLQEMVNGHRHDLHYTNGGKVCLVDQFAQLERKFDFIQETSARELNEINYRHKRRSKLLATLLLTKRVVDIANRNSYNSTLSIIRRHALIKNCSMQGLLRMRRILKQNRRSRLRRALYKWYFQELQPLRNFRQSKDCQKVLMKRHRGFRAFYAWRVALYRKVEQIHLKLSTLQSLVTMKTHKNQVAMKDFFVRWRYSANLRFPEWHKIQALKKLLVQRDTQILRNRLYRWKSLVLDLENQIQMRAMMKRFTLKTFLTSVFKNWKLVVADMKAKRMTLMSKAWKSLKICVMAKKQMRAEDILSSRELKMRWRKNILKSCFDALRFNKQEEKFLRVTRMLEEEEIPRKNQCLEDVIQIKFQRQRELLMKALQNIQSFRTRQYYQYFKHWKEKTDLDISVLNLDVKQRIISRYKSILSQAFARWVDFRNKSMIDQQNQTNTQWETANKALQFEIKGENVIIYNLKDRQKIEAAKLMKKLVMSAFERHLRVKYVKWRDSVNYLINREQRVEKILLKLHDRRLKKLGFNTFIDKVKICNDDIEQDKIGDRGRQTISDNLKRSCFIKMRQNAINSLHCKELMCRIMLKLDLNHKDEIFKLWLKYMNYQRERALESSQNKIVDTIALCQSEIGELSDSVEVQNQHNSQLRDRYKQTCQKIIALSFKRCHHMAHQYYFERWKNKVIEYQRGQKLIMNAAQHATTACIRYCFHQWVVNGSVNVKQRALISNLNYEERVIQNVKSEIEYNLHQHDFKTDYLQTKIQKENSLSQMLEVKHSRTLQSIVNRVNQNHHCLKLRYILTQWHQYVQTRKRCVRALHLAIQKTLWQNAFSAIKVRGREVYHLRLKEQHTTLFAMKFTKIKYRGYFHQWMAQGQIKVQQMSRRDKEDRSSRMKEQTKMIKTVNKRVQVQMLEHRQYITQFECFQAWRDEIKLLKAFKVKTGLYLNQKMERDQKNSVQLWRSRVKQTKKYRRGINQTSNLVISNLLHSAFDAWVHYNRINKDFSRSLSNLANKVDKVYLLRSFQSIKEHSETSNTVTLFSKFKACQYLFSTISSTFDSSSIRSTFYLIRHSGVRMNRNEKAIKSIVKYWVGHKLRGYIRQWKEETDRLETVRFNLQEGKTSVEVHNQRRTLNALKQMCLLEGISPQKIHKLIIKADEKTNETVMRVISRLLCHGDEQLRIIPSCFDRWRQWVRFRKMYALQLKFANSFANRKLHALYRAFRIWKNMKNGLKNQLNSLKAEVLTKLCVYNDGKLDNLAQSFDTANAEIEDLTSQRGILLQRYVSSQKLALSSVAKQNERAQQKVVSRWLSQCKRTEKVKLDQVLKQNLMRIASLKDRIKHLESSNQEIAIQNEDFRQGALDGIEMARNLDDLQREKEVLAIDLADKALVIRRLLEDNSNLNAQLAFAQEHAHRLIQITHARLNNNNIHLQ